MSVDFRQIHDQVKMTVERVHAHEGKRKEIQTQARESLSSFAKDQSGLQEKVSLAVRLDPSLRCALPGQDPLDGIFPAPDVPQSAVIIAADGSQINPDRHAEVDFSLINVGAIQMAHGGSASPREFISSQLVVEEALLSPSEPMTEGMLALMRDLAERKALLDHSRLYDQKPVITFTDGPLELWSRREQVSETVFDQKFREYLQVLEKLVHDSVITAGYVDKPGANYVIRLLEVGMASDHELADLRDFKPLRGATDLDLFEGILSPGDRSAVFGLQTKSARDYRDELALNFFYLNVGRVGNHKLARVEIPAWVKEDLYRLDALHAVLLSQCHILGSKSYPYILHRAHEAAVVTLDEQDQILNLILFEMRRRGLTVREKSEKQFTKTFAGRRRY